jgi:hypothetical protein
VRFVKPARVLEIGAGYTSLYILQALADNARELVRAQMLHTLGGCTLSDGTPWCVEDFVNRTEPRSFGRLHSVYRLPGA